MNQAKLLMTFNRNTQENIMECKKERNLEKCNCSYEPCGRKGTCCDCISFHLRMRELPACVFPQRAEATYDRSFEHFASLVKAGKV